MTCKMYAYLRVSARDQNLSRQFDAVQPYGIPPKQIFSDKVSGKDFDRPAYQKLIRRLRAGDVLFIYSIDRLGRDYTEILQQWRHITHTIGADIVVLDFPLLDTRRETADVTGMFISDLVLQILSYVAEIERSKILQRQAEGIAAAKLRGVRFGRPRRLLPEQYPKMKALYESGGISATKAAESLGISRGTFLSRCREEELNI